jgi:hypothetical protein
MKFVTGNLRGGSFTIKNFAIQETGENKGGNNLILKSFRLKNMAVKSYPGIPVELFRQKGFIQGFGKIKFFADKFIVIQEGYF